MLGPLLFAVEEECTGRVSCAVDKVGDAVGAVGDVVGATSKTLDFWSDPWGNTFVFLQDAAHSLAESVLPALSQATMPDLTAEWFLSAYSVSFAVAVFLAVFLTLVLGARTASGSMSGREMGESLFGWFPLFLGGAAFGPIAGVWLVSFFGALSDSFISWGIGGSADDVTATMTAMLDAEDASGLAGGAVVGSLLMIGMLAGLLLVLMVLVVQLVTLYLTGVLVPLGMAWMVDPRRRSWGARLLWVWIGILASHPLLFFLLGVVWRMTASQVDVLENVPGLADVVELVVTGLALLMASLSPFILLKLAAPIMPTGAGAGARAAGLPGGDRTYGEDSLTEVAQRYGQNPDHDGGQSPSRYDGPLSDGDESLPGPVAPAGRGGAPTSGAGPAAATGEGSLAARAGAGSAGATGAGTGAAATGGASAAGAAGTGAAVGAGEGLVAVGAAESATGAGAAIGIPTLVAGVAVVEAKQVADAAVQKVQELDDLVTDMVVDEAETYGREGLSSE